MTLTVRIMTPGCVIWEGNAQSIILPSSNGVIEILRSHVPLTTCLDLGTVKLRVDGQLLSLFILGGFAQVESDRVTVLANGAEWSSQIDLQEAQTALEVAENHLAEVSSYWEKTKAKKALKQAQKRLQAAQDSSSTVVITPTSPKVAVTAASSLAILTGLLTVGDYNSF